MSMSSSSSRKRPGPKPHKPPAGFAAALRGLSRAQLAQLFGISTQTVDRWRQQGLPQRADGLFDLAACCRWLRTTAELAGREVKVTDADTAKQLGRLRAVRTAREMLAFQKERGALISRAEAVAFASKAALVVRHRLQAAASILPQRLLHMGDPWEVQAVLQEEVDQILASFERGLEPLRGPETAAGGDTASDTTPQAPDEALDVGAPDDLSDIEETDA